MGSRRLTINTLPDDVFVEIFNIYRIDEVGHSTWRHRPWKWHRLAHVCRIWRHIMFASARHLRLELLCTHGTPVKKDLGYFPAFPLFISFLDSYFREGDRDNLFAALEHRDRVRVVGVGVPPSLLDALATVMQEPFPALSQLFLESEKFVDMPALPDTFLGGSAPRLQSIYVSRIPFPAAPTLLLSAPDLVDVELRDIPPTGYFPPEAMAASLAMLPRLRSLIIGFEAGVSYPDRMRLPPNTRAVLPVLTTFFFSGLFEYFENLVAQIDAPQLSCFRIEYLNQYGVTDFRIPQLCKFIDQLKSSQFIRADLLVEPSTVVIDLVHRDRSRFHLSVQEDAIGQVVSQISAVLSNVDRLSISSDFDEIVGNGIRWLEVFRPFTYVKALSVDGRLSRCAVPPALNNVTERAAEVLPALELLYLENHPVTSVKNFVAARQNTGRPVIVINEGKEFHERLNLLMSANRGIFRTH